MEAIAVALFVIFFLGIFAASIAGFVYWIIALLEVVRIPEEQYRAAGTDKLTWVLVVALAQVIGALIWLFAKRRDVLAAAGQRPPPPPGWYPHGPGGLRWWDGGRWTDDRPGP